MDGDRVVKTWTDENGVTRQEYANGIIAKVKSGGRKPRTVKIEDHFVMLRLAALGELTEAVSPAYLLLAIHVLWHWKVRGSAMVMSDEVCAMAGVPDARRRRRAVTALQDSKLFLVVRQSNKAPRVSPRPAFVERIFRQ